MDERLVLCHIVGCGEVDLQDIVQSVPFWRGDNDAGSQAGAHLGAVEMQPPVRGVRHRRQILHLGPVDEEVG